MQTRPVNGQTYTLGYDAEGRLVTVSGGSYSATFQYDGDGKRVKSTINSVSTLFVGNYYEKTGSTITKYYYAPPPPSAPPPNATIKPQMNYRLLTWSHLGEARWGSQSMVVEYFLGDHLGSTSIASTREPGDLPVSEVE